MRKSTPEPCRLAAPARTVVVLAMLGGCASAEGTAPKTPAREFVMAYDDSRPTGTMAFPSNDYESLVRFQLPEGEHQPLRVRLQAEAPGDVEITIYDSTIFETPGEPLRKIARALAKEDLSDGKDGRWVVEDLLAMKQLKGVVWIGVHKLGGEPTLWACSVASGQVYVRNNDPKNPMGLLPTKRTPMLRLEVAP
jgi:hypothetical protein